MSINHSDVLTVSFNKIFPINEIPKEEKDEIFKNSKMPVT